MQTIYITSTNENCVNKHTIGNSSQCLQFLCAVIPISNLTFIERLLMILSFSMGQLYSGINFQTSYVTKKSCDQILKPVSESIYLNIYYTRL